MQTLKFRVWDKMTKKMSLVAQIHYGDDGFAKTITIITAPKQEYRWGLVHGESGELMQFTGLLDKNNKEIYEGDIILSSIWPDRKFVVEWENAGFVHKPVDDDGFREEFHESDKIEVIGNIYENTELLKV